MKWDGHEHWGRKLRSSIGKRLDTKWVKEVWPDRVDRNEWMKYKYSWVELSAGDPSRRINRMPPFDWVGDTCIPYTQRGKTCLAMSLASAIHMVGYEEKASILRGKITRKYLCQGSPNFIQNFVNEVNRLKLCDSAGTFLSLTRQKDYDIYTGPTPAVVVLQGTDYGIGHAISVLENSFIDASFCYPLPRTKETLDWCCSPAKFYQPNRVYVLKVVSAKQKPKPK